MDLQSQIETSEEFEIESEEKRLQVIALTESIFTKYSEEEIKRLFITNLRKIMIVWTKAKNQDYDKVKKLSDEKMWELILDTQEKFRDEYHENNQDVNEELRTLIEELLHDKEIINEQDFEKQRITLLHG